ncbi:hypothetical protein [Desulfolithobacter sp.]
MELAAAIAVYVGASAWCRGPCLGTATHGGEEIRQILTVRHCPEFIEGRLVSCVDPLHELRYFLFPSALPPVVSPQFFPVPLVGFPVEMRSFQLAQVRLAENSPWFSRVLTSVSVQCFGYTSSHDQLTSTLG